MRAVIVAVGIAATAAMAASTGAIAKPTREGRVVRVERPRSFHRQALRICHMETAQVGQGTCYGGIPEIADEAEVYDNNGYQGRIRITDVKPVSGDLCSGDSGGEIFFEYLEGKGVINYNVQRLAVFGAGTDREISRAMDAYGTVKPPTGNARDQPFMVLDRNGDGREDLMSTVYECPTIAPPNPYQGTITGGYNMVWCVDYWRRENSSWDMVRQDYYYSCR
jgi:hypothetical protein